MIYLDHASTTNVLPEYIDTIKRLLETQWYNPSNLYKVSEEPKRIIEEARVSIAKRIGAEPCEIFFTSGASEGNAWICEQATKILCSQYEHHNLTRNPKSVIIDEQYLDQAIASKRLASSQGFTSDYSHMICSWMYVNNETGEIFDIKNIAKKAHKLGMLFHSDMTQALGNVPINVKELGVDFATFTGHKIHTPKGIGFIYVNKDNYGEESGRVFKRYIFGGMQEHGFRAGTENVAFIEVLRMAVYHAVINRVSKQNYCLELKKLMVEELNKQGVQFIINSPGNSVNNILNISIKDYSGEAIMMDLSDRNIYVGVGSACNSGDGKPSEVLEAMGIDEEYIQGALRFSFDWSIGKDDIKSVAWHIADIIRGYN